MPRDSAADEMLSILFALNLRSGLTERQAIESAREAVRLLTDLWGGLRIYWPQSHHEIEARAIRDAQIRELAAGLSLAELAERFGLSVARISQIVTAGEPEPVKPFALPVLQTAAASRQTQE